MGLGGGLPGGGGLEVEKEDSAKEKVSSGGSGWKGTSRRKLARGRSADAGKGRTYSERLGKTVSSLGAEESTRAG